MDDSIPTEEEVVRALFQLKNWKAPGMTGITADLLKTWYCMSHPKEGRGDPDLTALENWEVVVELVRLCFQGEIPTAHTIGVLVIIPKDDKGGVRGIGLLEAIHKLVSCVINMRIQKAVRFSEEVHGFRAKRGCITAVGKAKIRMQIAACKNETTYHLYLDLKKAYDSIDWDRTLEVMRKYRVGSQICRYVKET